MWRVWRMCWTFTRNPMTQSARWSVSDETSKQLLAEKRSPIPPKPARRERYDYEYQRNGTRNLFMLCEPLAGWRHVAVTERRTMVDFAKQMRWLADEAYPASEKMAGPQHPQTSFPLRNLRAQGGLLSQPNCRIEMVKLDSGPTVENLQSMAPAWFRFASRPRCQSLFIGNTSTRRH